LNDSTLSVDTQPDPELCSHSALDELYRRAEITKKARYHGARRLAYHAWFSQWTLALLAVGQIVISLIPALKLRSNFSESYLNFGGIFFGVLVLAYSLLLGMANFSARAQKLHECGLELGRLSRELLLWSCGKNATNKQYSAAVKNYYDILDRHENHTPIDYKVANYEHYFFEETSLKNCNGRTDLVWKCLKYQWRKIVIYGSHFLQFSHYVFSVFLVAFWIYFCVVKNV
jgi:SMODS and SLOG-associating 2TM effector domain family 5